MAQFLPYIAAVAIGGATEAIKIYMAGKKQDKVDELTGELKSLKQDQADLVNTEKRRVLTAQNRVKIANYHSKLATSGQVTEATDPRAKIGTQGIETARIGAEDYLTRTAGLGTQIIDKEEAVRQAAEESLFGAGTGALMAGAGIASSVLASGEFNTDIKKII